MRIACSTYSYTILVLSWLFFRQKISGLHEFCTDYMFITVQLNNTLMRHEEQITAEDDG